LLICCILSGVNFIGLPRLSACGSNWMASVISCFPLAYGRVHISCIALDWRGRIGNRDIVGDRAVQQRQPCRRQSNTFSSLPTLSVSSIVVLSNLTAA
jgi:hypothetical protein